MEVTYTEMLKLNSEFKKNAKSESYNVAVLSNIIINQFCPFLEYELQRAEVNAVVSSGNYDNIAQDSEVCKDQALIIVFWELCNIIDGLQYKANVMTPNETQALLDKVTSEIDFVFQNLKNSRQIIINKFSTLIFNHHFLRSNNFDLICKQLNAYLEKNAPQNTVLIDIDKIIAKTSIQKSVDFRNFYSSKALYSTDFYRTYAKYIKPVVFSILGKAKKAVIFDCDNTLWAGILGEDGELGIQMSSTTKKGVYFEEIQYLAKQLAKKGIVVGLNSKNNDHDVDKVLSTHSDIRLSDKDIAIKKVNWNDKVSNLTQIASQLNIGIDSIVFVDDSDFEVNLVKEYLPNVTALQVPKQLYLYPELIRDHFDVFYNIKETEDDQKRIDTYKTQSLRDDFKAEFVSIEDYLISLKLEMRIYIDDLQLIDRMSQLTHKTNQFNLTTKRYTVTEVDGFVNSNDYITFAFDVKDRFGAFGIVGTSFIEIINDIAFIDTFLMSCRVLGRNIEFSFLNEILKHLKEIGIVSVKALYVETNKNAQVSHFYERAGFDIEGKEGQQATYSLSLNNFTENKITYIKIAK